MTGTIGQKVVTKSEMAAYASNQTLDDDLTATVVDLQAQLARKSESIISLRAQVGAWREAHDDLAKTIAEQLEMS